MLTMTCSICHETIDTQAHIDEYWVYATPDWYPHTGYGQEVHERCLPDAWENPHRLTHAHVYGHSGVEDMADEYVTPDVPWHTPQGHPYRLAVVRGFAEGLAAMHVGSPAQEVPDLCEAVEDEVVAALAAAKAEELPLADAEPLVLEVEGPVRVVWSRIDGSKGAIGWDEGWTPAYRDADNDDLLHTPSDWQQHGSMNQSAGVFDTAEDALLAARLDEYWAEMETMFNIVRIVSVAV